jgi:hypothetical protein
VERPPVAPERSNPTPPAPLHEGGTSTPEWLLRVFVESVLIVISILLALAVDQWRESSNNRHLAQQSLEIFQREIRQNLAKLEDALPFHQGMRNVVAGMAAGPEEGADLQTLMEGLEPLVLQNTAWETALATGALTHIDVNTVNALSLTYSHQERFREESRLALPRITVAATGAELAAQVRVAAAYLNELVRSELELRGVYREALVTTGAGGDSIRSDSRDVAHP